MQSNKIDAGTFSKMFLAGAKRLEDQKEIINELNVFPVPDGDTGTNMTLTIISAVKEVEAISDMNMATLSKAISSGSLRGARGNSGVILSQLFRGFTKVVKESEELDIEIFTQGMQKAVETAYKAVMKPKEGTILTVAKAAADEALRAAEEVDDFDTYLKRVIGYADEVLQKTPDMLPVLKEAGVVDSGGQGLIEVFKGAYAAFSGKDADEVFKREEKENVEESSKEEVSLYNTRLTVVKNDAVTGASRDALVQYLNDLGSDVVVEDKGDSLFVSICTGEPGRIVTKALSYGYLDSVDITPVRGDNNSDSETAMPEKDVKVEESVATEVVNEPEAASIPAPAPEVAAEAIKDTEEIAKSEDKNACESADEDYKEDNEETADVPKEYSKEMGFVAVSCGSGLDQIFKSLGVDYLITGGQTMNPSTEDMLNAISQVDAGTVFILPNNKNIIMAANQAQYLVEDKEIIVIPTKTIPQGITALITFMSDSSVADNENSMNEAISNVKTGQVTYAVRDTSIGGIEIKKGNIMGIGDHEILSVGVRVEDTAFEMISCMVEDDSEVISIYYGEEVDEEIANEFAKSVEEKYPDISVELHQGGQPIYYYIVSVE